MSSNSKIEWTEATWSPVAGCTRVSEGCRNCYAERMTATRLKHTPKYEGLAVLNNDGEARWTNKIRLHEDALGEPLRWRKPRTVFVCSMSDLFHPEVPFEFIGAVHKVIAACPQHTFQILTKRPERAFEFYAWLLADDHIAEVTHGAPIIASRGDFGDDALHDQIVEALLNQNESNRWLGTSVENQQTADERIPHLLRCPAAVRFLSCEPLLGPVDLIRACDVSINGECPAVQGIGDFIHWVIVGGESGPKARPCSIEWIRSIRDQCKAATVPCFVKQLGSWPMEIACQKTDKPSMKWRWDDSGEQIERWYQPKDRKGGDWNEWPKDLRVREMPEIASNGETTGRKGGIPQIPVGPTNRGQDLGSR